MNKDRKVRIGDAAKILNVSVQTLRNWEKSGKLKPHRSDGKQRYYLLQDIERFAMDIEKLGLAWAKSALPPDLPSEYYCERQDRFTSCVARMGLALQQTEGMSADVASLLTLVAGEIGDNSFAHNIGNWPDTPGVFYAYDPAKQVIVLADRGRGVKATLRVVRPNLANDMEALRVAFMEIVSGRNPEKRGNGLKVVRRVAETTEIGLLFRSGLGRVDIPLKPGHMRIAMADEHIRGTFAVIRF